MYEACSNVTHYGIGLDRGLEGVKNGPHGCCNSHSIETPPAESSQQRTQAALVPLHNHIRDIIVQPKYPFL